MGLMDGDFDLNALAAKLPQPSLDDILRARREDEQAPPTVSTIPYPEFPGRFSTVARFRCPLDCGWHHDEATDSGPMGTLLLPADFTSDDLSAAVGAQAEVRGNNFRLRVEQAIADHFDSAHPDH